MRLGGAGGNQLVGGKLRGSIAPLVLLGEGDGSRELGQEALFSCACRAAHSPAPSLTSRAGYRLWAVSP